MKAHGDCCLPVRTLIAADIAANRDAQHVGALDTVLSVLWARSVQALLLHRLAHAAWCRRLTAVSELLLRVSQLVFGIDISYRASIGPGLVLRHAMNVVIGSEAHLGKNIRIFNGVTIGKRLSGSAERPDGMATVEDGVLLGVGCALLGPITIGGNSTIGANVVVSRDIPAGSVVIA